MAMVFISIGSNVGDRMANCTRAIDELGRAQGVTVTARSSFYETEPWGGITQADFINCVIEASVGLTPRDLLALLKSIEKRLGRTGTVRLGPREIDLDIIFYGDSVIDEAGLNVPHPHAHERAFVLVPMREIAPGFIHPVLKKTVTELAAAIEGAQGVKKLTNPGRIP